MLGFCSSCMCRVCLNFDSASNTCSWVGCDACSHWCHTACGIQRNLIKPGPSLKGSSRNTEMQLHCIGCSHASEMFGFVKDVFVSCAKEWGFETLIKELDCVRKIFRGSEDPKGRELHVKADGLLTKLEGKMISAWMPAISLFNSLTTFLLLLRLVQHIRIFDSTNADLENSKIPSSSEFKNKPDGWETTSKTEDGNVWEMSQREEDILLQEFDRRIAYCKFQGGAKKVVISAPSKDCSWFFILESVCLFQRMSKM